MSYPSSLPSYTNPTSGEILQAGGHTNLHVTEENDITAIATKIGTGASTPTSGLPLVGNGTGTSAWGQVPLTTGVSGVLPVASGGTGSGSSTGSGAVVLQTAPTITSPTESGGTYNTATLNTPTINYNTSSIPANAIVNGSLTNNQIANGGVNFANLLSNIFSGQVQTYTNTGAGGGTGYYVNLGGIKLCWGVSGSFTPANGSNNSISFPVGFFATVQYGTFFNVNNSGTGVSWTQTVIATTGLTAFSNNSGGTAQAAWIAIGT
jgi:hypothetical protein